MFQQAYAESFDDADSVIIAEPYDTSGIPESERFDAHKLAGDILDRGTDATCLEGAEAIAATLVARARPRDVIALFSNGAFGGVHQKVLEGLSKRF